MLATQFTGMERAGEEEKKKAKLISDQLGVFNFLCIVHHEYKG